MDPNDELVEIRRLALELEYAIDEDWTVGASFTHIQIDRSLPPAGLRERIDGVGDTELRVRWRAWDSGEPELDAGEEEDWLRPEPRWSLQLLAGMTLPSGDERKPLLGASGTPISFLQTGNGIVTPIVGASLRADWGGLAARADLRVRIPPYENRFDYREGTSVVAGLGLEARPVRGLQLGVGVEAEWRERDRLAGAKVDAGGGWRVVVRPSVAFAAEETVSLYLGVTLPVYRDPDILVLDTDLSLEAGLVLRF